MFIKLYSYAVIHLPFTRPDLDNLRPHQGRVVQVIEVLDQSPLYDRTVRVQFIDHPTETLDLYSDTLIPIVTAIQYAKAEWETPETQTSAFAPGDRVKPATRTLLLFDKHQNAMIQFGQLTLFVVVEYDTTDVVVHTLNNPQRTFRAPADCFVKQKTHHDL